jgi:protein TonB
MNRVEATSEGITMLYTILPLSIVALLAGCASSQQARVEPATHPAVVTEPVPVSSSVATPPVAVTAASASQTATTSPSVAPTYYHAYELDVHPRPLNAIEPNFPAEADLQEMSGKVRLQLILEADGRVSDIRVVSADPPGIFNDSAVKAFRDARFAPAQKDGKPVPAVMLIEVVYEWSGPQ